MNFIKNQELTLSITGITQEGNGVGKVDGYTIFTPLTAIGDEVKVQLVKIGKSYGYARLIEIITPSNDRLTEVDCPFFSQCGGCSLRHISYESELAIKSSFVQENFRRIGKIDLPVSPITPSPSILRYRNKALYPVRIVDGKPTIGFYAKRSHRLIPVSDCLLEPAVFSEISHFTEHFLLKNGITIYNEETGKGKIRHLFLRISESTGEIAAGLVVNSKSLFQGQKWATALTSRFPSVKSVFVNSNQEKNNVILGKETTFFTEKETIRDTLSGLLFDISPASFYQVNKKATELLYAKAKSLAQLTGEETILDLYCGIGTIGLSMADQANHLIGVEIVPEAVENAKKNAKLNQISNTHFISNNAETAAKELLNERISPNIIIVDPPRKGCEEELLHTIHSLSPEKIIMISCDSATAARDVSRLSALGYEPVSITPVDLFPRTTHVETICLLKKNGN